MRKIALILFVCIAVSMSAQKVGLVLSGGGGPGIAHIGVIKALEENDIPIDYITATSIGSIIGGMYAMGMSPSEMIAFLKSGDFQRLSTGERAISDRYSYFEPDNKAGLIGLDLETSPALKLQLPASIFPPHEMNYALVSLCTQASGRCRNNFDSLFVPFRCVASDVYNKKAVVFNRGNLSDAIRASMTFPFIFRVAENENRLLFDGGIYNNFPADVMQDDFNPGYSIGSVVAYNPPKADKHNAWLQLQNMVVNPTDYSFKKDEGLLINFDLKQIDTFDFSHVDELVQVGYDSIMKHIDEIKTHVRRRILPAEVETCRHMFRDRFSKIVFGQVKIEGATETEKAYVLSFFRSDKKSVELKDFRKAYYQLLSGETFSEITPQAQFDDSTGTFDLRLKTEVRPPLRVSLGTNISTTGANLLYLGLTYRTLSRWVQTFFLDAQAGGFYNGISLGSKVELPSATHCYLRVSGVLHQFNYPYQTGSINFNQNEAYGILTLGLGIIPQARFELGAGYGLLAYHYNADSLVNPARLLNKESSFHPGQLFALLESNVLNHSSFATEGYQYRFKIQYFKNVGLETTGLTSHWLQFKAKGENYFSINSRTSLGLFGELVYSTARPLDNYRLTLLNAPAFQPTAFSHTLFNPNFSCYRYAAIGLKPVYRFSRNLQFRTELYGFLPFQRIIQNTDNSVCFSDSGFSVSLLGESALVYSFQRFSVAALTHYSRNNWQVGLNIGIQLFNSKFED